MPFEPMPLQIEAAIIDLLARRGVDSTICPSEAARALTAPGSADAWRALMPRVRDVAQAMADREWLQITQRGLPVARSGLHHGAIRLRRGPRFPG
jgi:hypothetical protein